MLLVPGSSACSRRVDSQVPLSYRREMPEHGITCRNRHLRLAQDWVSISYKDRPRQPFSAGGVPLLRNLQRPQLHAPLLVIASHCLFSLSPSFGERRLLQEIFIHDLCARIHGCCRDSLALWKSLKCSRHTCQADRHRAVLELNDAPPGCPAETIGSFFSNHSQEWTTALVVHGAWGCGRGNSGTERRKLLDPLP